MRDYEPYSFTAADAYDSTFRLSRLIISLIVDLMDGKTIRQAYVEFLNFEIYLSQQSLKRKLNKLRFMGLMDEDYNT